jgi:hypothetical protein
MEGKQGNKTVLSWLIKREDAQKYNRSEFNKQVN